jgi:hypothetical protein
LLRTRRLRFGRRKGRLDGRRFDLGDISPACIRPNCEINDPKVNELNGGQRLKLKFPKK